jgi:hypothetical protein
VSLAAFLALLGSLLKATVNLDERAWKRVTGIASRPFGERAPETSYENLSLSISLELLDTDGERAVIKRVQRVRFLTEDAGVVRDVVWGSGRPLAGYSSTGAERLGVRHEGSKRVVLLGLPTNPRKGEVVTIRTEREIRGAFQQDECYLEAVIERPTRLLTLSVTFPRGRVPKSAFLESSPPTLDRRPLRATLEPRNRARVKLFLSRPRSLVTYRIRWTW